MGQIAGWANEWANPDIRSDYPGFILAPQLPANTTWTNMMTHVVALIDQLKNSWSIDDNRIYAGGYSLGGFGVWWAILQPLHQGYFAAGFPIAGNTNLTNLEDLVDYPLWLFYGENDGSIVLARNNISGIRDAGGTPLFTEHPGLGHNNILQKVRKDTDLMPWMYAQTKAGGNLPPPPINVSVDLMGNIATISWDMPTLPLVDTIMAYHVYKNGTRLTNGLEDLMGSDGSGLSTLHRSKSYVDSTYMQGDIYQVTALNYRNQESQWTTSTTGKVPVQRVISVYPNPTTSHVQVFPQTQGIKEYQVFDVSGSFVKQGDLDRGMIPLSELPPGLYIIKVGSQIARVVKSAE